MGALRDKFGVLCEVWSRKNGNGLNFLVLGDSENGELVEPLNIGKLRLSKHEYLIGTQKSGKEQILLRVGQIGKDVIKHYSLTVDGSLRKVSETPYYNDSRDELGGPSDF